MEKLSDHHIIITVIIVLLFFTNLTFSSNEHRNHGFFECLTDSHLTTDIIFTPETATYASFFSLTPNLRPGSISPERPDLIVTPFQVSEIQAAIYCSKKLDVQIRVRSGGHDYEGLSYTSGIPFVIVDMRNFRSITVDNDEVDGKTAWVQVGATLGQLYYTLSRKSNTLAFPAGVCPTVGVGGHFSGGGFSMMSRKHSLSADHIIDAKLINANGGILDRESMGEDLFWAIRGGGGTSFGIVVEFKVTLVTVPETVTVFNVTRTLEENATELVHKWQYIADKVDENLLIRLFFQPHTTPTTGKRTVAVSFTSLYLGRARNLVAIMQEQFPDLGLTERDCIEMSWIESVLYMSGFQEQPLEILLDTTPQGIFAPIYYKGKSDYVTTPIPVNGLRELWRFLLKEEDHYFQLQFSPYGGVLNTFTESETPFPHRRGNIFMIEYAAVWRSPDESETHIDWIRRLYSSMASYVTKSPRAAYFNHRDLDIGRNNQSNTSYDQASVWGLPYFKNNFRRLVRVKTQVDPSNFFRNEQSIPPLVSDAIATSK